MLPAFSPTLPVSRSTRPCSIGQATCTNNNIINDTTTPLVPAPRVRMVQTPTRRAKRANNNNTTDTATTSGSSTQPTAKTKGGATIPSVVVLGLSHHTATVDVREQLAVPEAEWQLAAQELLSLEGVDEAAVLSTCNRFEVYIVTTTPYSAIQAVVSHLSTRKGGDGMTVGELRRHLFMLIGDDAVWHLLRVSAGLDSLVVGEGQILSQVKKCYELATQKASKNANSSNDDSNINSVVGGAAGKILSRFLNIAVSAGKRVRSETEINKGAVSISSAAVELAGMKLDEGGVIAKRNLESCNITIIGAGKMSRLLVQHLSSRGVANISIVNRSRERCEELQKQFPDVRLDIHLMDEMEGVLAEKSDIVFTSTAATEPILTRDNLSALNRNRNIMLIDISVPRNVSSDAGEVPNVHAYNVDDLKAVVAKNQLRRRKLILEAETVLREEQKTFNNWMHSLGCIPCISKLQQRAEGIRSDELLKFKGKLAGLSKAERNAVEALSKGIINKMLHSPMVHLRGLEDMEERSQTLRNIEALFKL